MGQKVHPIGFRLGFNQDWRSNWYAEKKAFGDFLHEDIKIRNFIKKRLYFAGVSKITIDRAGSRSWVVIHTSRPGIIIGRGGKEIEKLKDDLQDITSSDSVIDLDVKEVKQAETDAQLVAENIALQLERRVAFRRAMKKSVSSAMNFGAKGIKVKIAGRLGGADMSRTEGYKEGKIPLHTLRSNIDYGFAIASTTYGTIGVKVWICKGELLPGEVKETENVNA
ncbi:MAG: 30S ribosomal protein S3 [Candidatus Margulisbacteria bacterium]|nr:30S ribosomal protein S3 [Candidatus Margulisiibacteriota bacterium]